MAILADTSALIAFIDRSDLRHAQVRRLFETTREALLVPLLTLPEVAYLAQKYLGPKAERAFLEDVLRGEFVLEWGQDSDLKRAAEILEKRPDLGLVDASIMALAERLGIRKVATFDRRHFGTFKNAWGEAFELLP